MPDKYTADTAITVRPGAVQLWTMHVNQQIAPPIGPAATVKFVVQKILSAYSALPETK